MPYFALQVKSLGETRYIALARKKAADIAGRIFFLRRSLRVKKGGSWRERTAPVFPGYVFLSAEKLDGKTAGLLRSVSGFLRFLPSTDRAQPLSARDEAMLRHFLSFGEVARKSVVAFDEQRRIRVISGPLKGLDGLIIKVDRRKQRARVRLSLYDESFEIDFGFEALEPATGTAAGAPE